MMALSFVKEGQEVKVIAIRGGKGAVQRLAEMGILPGVRIKVISNSGGPIVIALGNSRIALGKGLASKIICA
ncbi:MULTISPECIES: FeoA family protein [Dictyoglomus]|jgi:ferrous iron transport protein A|uniref:FeoA family protein n=2 Tax=Dictyoglomus turgidum TaxID=513050 RepID=B8DZ99_DICTD|nr:MULTISPECIES: FeoA family protein [Dictyoglomus]ACK41832.1 FeoA family protein [Dictyoglomus turgidum DSM 6724]PNV79730.1 MAG: ferrous iron transport protein A [Dictyoglomus turgidum]HBU31313.1 ferrous iron transport protein A [Dictyoglomus sp.]